MSLLLVKPYHGFYFLSCNNTFTLVKNRDAYKYDIELLTYISKSKINVGRFSQTAIHSNQN